MTKSVALNNKHDAARQQLKITGGVLLYEAAMAHNLMLNYGGSSPTNALLGDLPKDFYASGSITNSAFKGSLEQSTDTFEQNIRMRQHSGRN